MIAGLLLAAIVGGCSSWLGAPAWAAYGFAMMAFLIVRYGE